MPAISSETILVLLILVSALLYSSVGHAGASAYLASMALMGVAPASMKPTALVLNILVATIATVQFARVGCFSWRLFLPFAAGAIPLSFVGGAWQLPGTLYKQTVGAVLVFAAARLALGSRRIVPSMMRRLLAVVLLIADGKLIAGL